MEPIELPPQLTKELYEITKPSTAEAIHPWWTQFSDMEATATDLFASHYEQTGGELLIGPAKLQLDQRRQFFMRMKDEDAQVLEHGGTLDSNTPLYFLRLVETKPIKAALSGVSAINAVSNILFATRIYWEGTDDYMIYALSLKKPLKVTQQLGVEFETNSGNQFQLTVGYKSTPAGIFKLPVVKATEKIRVEDELGNTKLFNEPITLSDLPEFTYPLINAVSDMGANWAEVGVSTYLKLLSST